MKHSHRLKELLVAIRGLPGTAPFIRASDVAVNFLSAPPPPPQRRGSPGQTDELLFLVERGGGPSSSNATEFKDAIA